MCVVFLIAILLANLSAAAPLTHSLSNPPACGSLSVTVLNKHTTDNIPVVHAHITSSSPALRLSNARVEWYDSLADPTDDPFIDHQTPDNLRITQKKDLAYSIHLRAVQVSSENADIPLVCRFQRPSPRRCSGTRVYSLAVQNAEDLLLNSSHTFPTLLATHTETNQLFTPGSTVSAAVRSFAASGDVHALFHSVAYGRTKVTLQASGAMQTATVGEQPHAMLHFEANANRSFISTLWNTALGQDVIAGIDSFNLCVDGTWIENKHVGVALQRFQLTADGVLSPLRADEVVKMYAESGLRSTALQMGSDPNQNYAGDAMVSGSAQLMEDAVTLLGEIRAGAQMVRTDYDYIIEVLTTYASTRSEFKALEKRMADACDYTVKKQNLYKRVKNKLKLMTRIPLSAIKKLAQAFNKVTSRLGKALDQEKTSDPICDSINRVNLLVDKTINNKLKSAFNLLADVTKYFDKTFKAVEVTIALFESDDSGFWPVYEAATSRTVLLTADRQELCTTAVSLRDNIQAVETKSSAVREIMQHIREEVTRLLDATKKGLEPPESFYEFALDLFGGPLGTVLGVIEKIFEFSVKLPIPGGAKDRGTSISPKCCPSGYKKELFTCLKKCDSGDEEVGDRCYKKCKSGYKTFLLVSCKRKKFPWKIKSRGSYKRSSKAFGCSCNSKKKYKDFLGLCMAKCGKDSYANYPTAILNLCWDFRMKTVKVSDLLDVLWIFDKIKEIPGLGDAIKFVESTLDKLVDPIISLIEELINVPSFNIKVRLPTVNFDASVSNLEYLSEQLNGAIADVERVVTNLTCP